MKWLNKIVPAPTQPFAPRSDRMNFLLRASQGLVAMGISYGVMHADLTVPVVAIFGAGVVLAQTIAMLGWQREMVRHVHAAA